MTSYTSTEMAHSNENTPEFFCTLVLFTTVHSLLYLRDVCGPFFHKNFYFYFYFIHKNGPQLAKWGGSIIYFALKDSVSCRLAVSCCFMIPVCHTLLNLCWVGNCSGSSFFTKAVPELSDTLFSHWSKSSACPFVACCHCTEGLVLRYLREV